MRINQRLNPFFYRNVKKLAKFYKNRAQYSEISVNVLCNSIGVIKKWLTGNLRILISNVIVYSAIHDRDHKHKKHEEVVDAWNKSAGRK